MAKVIFTPWKTQAQLLAARDQFYPPPSYTGPDLRAQACAKVSSWKLRGNLPHPVEATSLLTDAILHDDAGKNSIFSIRATYSAAFCRFVTGLVDSKLHGQRRTMFQRAVDVGVPASFVELRHEATHRELPALIVLRNATLRSLEWLWDFYWAKIDPHGPAPGSELPAEAVLDDDYDDDHADAVVKESVRGSLGLLSTGGGEGEGQGQGEGEAEPPRKKRKALQFQSQERSATATQLVSICKASRKGVFVLSRVLLDEGVIIPSGRRLGDSLQPTFAKWEHLLQMITESHPAFLSSLTEEMVNDLAFTDSNTDTKNNAHSEGIYMWLDHILRSTEWKPSRRLLSFAYLLAVCEGVSGNRWTDALKGVLVREEEKRAKVATGKNPGADATKAVNVDVDAHVDDDAAQLRKFGWESLDVWDSRPLGVV